MKKKHLETFLDDEKTSRPQQKVFSCVNELQVRDVDEDREPRQVTFIKALEHNNRQVHTGEQCNGFSMKQYKLLAHIPDNSDKFKMA